MFPVLAQLDEIRYDVALASEVQKKHIKAYYDQNVKPRSYGKGDLVLVYDQEHDKLGISKFKPMWHDPYVVNRALAKGAHELVDYEWIRLGKHINDPYLKKYYA